MEFLEQGASLITDLADDAILLRVKAQAARCVRSHRKTWIAGIRHGTESCNYSDIEISSGRRDVFDDFLSAMSERVTEKVGVTSSICDVRLRITTPYPFAYLPWHWDYLGMAGYHVKLIVYLSDVLPGGGEFCYVPKSQLIPSDELLKTSARDVASRLGYRRFPGVAGTGVLFDVRGVHGVMRNSTRVCRVAMIVSFSLN